MPTSSVYTRNGQLHSHFDRQRKDELEAIGRDAGRELFEWYGGTVEDNDVKEDGTLDWQRADLKVTFNDGRNLLVETATKSDNIWHYTKQGVDVETRKLKYIRQMGAEKLVVSMTRQNGSEILLIPGVCLKAAADDCGDEYLGHGSIANSPNFQMPSHGCHRVRKNCKKKGGGWEVNDFYRIPYKFVTHIEVLTPGKNYRILKKKEPFGE